MLGAIAGAIAEPFYGGIPGFILQKVAKKLPHGYKNTIIHFYEKFGTKEMVKQSLSLSSNLKK